MGQQKEKQQILKQQIQKICFLAAIVIVLMVVLFVSWPDKEAVVSNGRRQDDIAAATAESVSINDEFTEYLHLLQVGVEDNSLGVRKAVGTGVVYHVSGEGVWIATTAHVLENKDEEDVITLTAKGMELQCERWVVTEDTDLVFLYLEYADIVQKNEVCEASGRNRKIVFVPIETDKASYDALSKETVVEASGYCNGELVEYQGELVEPWIYVEDFEQYMMLAECAVKHGMSGGGLYDAEGRFIGMVCGGNKDGELAAMPWHVMQARFEEIDIYSHF